MARAISDAERRRDETATNAPATPSRTVTMAARSAAGHDRLSHHARNQSYDNACQDAHDVPPVQSPRRALQRGVFAFPQVAASGLRRGLGRAGVRRAPAPPSVEHSFRPLLRRPAGVGSAELFYVQRAPVLQVDPQREPVRHRRFQCALPRLPHSTLVRPDTQAQRHADDEAGD